MSESIVESYYRDLHHGEWNRFDTPKFRVEFLSTLLLIDKYLPGTGRALDLGGGPGRYTVELLQRGYEVTLFDLSRNLVNLARERLQSLHLTAKGLEVGDARDLSRFAATTFDVVLVMGPLYHLPELDDRMRVMREARRVMKPGGRAILAYLNGWGLARTGLSDLVQRVERPDYLDSMMDEGTIDRRLWYYSNPNRARTEIEEAGFRIVTYIGAEGFAGGMTPILERLAADNPLAYEQAIQAAAHSSALPQYRDATDHLHFIVE